MNKSILVLICIICNSLTPVNTQAYILDSDAPVVDDPTQTTPFNTGKAWTFALENDLFALEDNGYTNGIAFSLAQGPFTQFSNQNLPDWLYQIVQNSYIAKLPNRRRAVTYTFGQAMQTPENTEATELQVFDVPYAGMLLGQVRFNAADDIYSDSLTIGVGVIGPWSLAEQSQKIIHSATGSDIAQGWDNQLDNEVVFLIKAGKGRRLFASPAYKPVEFDLIVRASAAVGTIYSAATGTVVVRIGNELAISHPTASLLPERQVNPLAFSRNKAWYGFVGADISWVANDIFINGNTFSDSHSLPLSKQRTRLAAGIGWNIGSLAFSLAYVESHLSGDLDPFGSLSITKRY